MFKTQKVKFVTLSTALAVLMGTLFSSPAKAIDWNTCNIIWFQYQVGGLTGAAPDIVKDQQVFGGSSNSPECQGYVDHYDSTMLESVAHAGSQFNFVISGNYVGNNTTCNVEVLLNGSSWISGSTHFEAGDPAAQNWYEPSLSEAQKGLFNSLTGIGDNEFAVTTNCPGHEQANLTLRANLKIVQDSYNDFEGVSIDEGAEFSNSRNVNIDLSFDSGVIGEVMISNDGGFPSSQREVITYSRNIIPWTLNATRDERMVKTIYVKYKRINQFTGELESSWSNTLTDDIILDTTEPVIESASASVPINATSSLLNLRSLSEVKNIDVLLNANDNKSGVNEIQYASNENALGAVTKSYSSSFSASIDANASTLYLRVSDRAGNWSPWKLLPIVDRASADLAARTISIKKKYSAKQVAKQVGVVIVSSKAKVSFKVAKSSKKVCTKSGSKLKTLKPGTCVVTFTVQEPKPKKGKKPKAKKTAITFTVQ